MAQLPLWNLTGWGGLASHWNSGNVDKRYSLEVVASRPILSWLLSMNNCNQLSHAWYFIVGFFGRCEMSRLVADESALRLKTFFVYGVRLSVFEILLLDLASVRCQRDGCILGRSWRSLTLSRCTWQDGLALLKIPQDWLLDVITSRIRN